MSMIEKKALLIINVGTPAQPTKQEVRKYLSLFLNDKRVIDIPWLLRVILVNGIIIPFRVEKSTALYQRLWTDKGSPLLIYLNNLKQKLQLVLNDEFSVYAAMRYGQPSLSDVLLQMHKDGIEVITVLPLFPQYASATTGSAVEKVKDELLKWPTLKIKVIQQFYNHPAFIKAFTGQILQHNLQDYDHIIFSYHGLPLKQINKVHPGKDSVHCSCTHEMPYEETVCYKATCYETTRLLANVLRLTPDRFSTSFQSRLTKNWLQPFTDQIIILKAQEGAKRILIVAPSFVADCLETLIEIGSDYRKLFIQHGGKELVLVESLNDHDEWAQAIALIIR